MSAVEAQSPGRLLKPETTTATMSAVEEESPGPRIKPETTTATIFVSYAASPMFLSWRLILEQVILTSGLAGFTHAYATNAITGSLAQTSFIEKFLTVSNAHQIQAAMLSMLVAIFQTSITSG